MILLILLFYNGFGLNPVSFESDRILIYEAAQNNQTGHKPRHLVVG